MVETVNPKNMDKEDGVIGVVLIVLACCVCILIGGFRAYNIPIESKHRIAPDMEIRIKDGKADTVFIYRRP